jgi:thiol:disulfide interchange protein DsbC
VRWPSALGGGLAAILCASALAASPASGDGEAAARRLAERAFIGKRVESFRQLPGLPFYEMWIDHTLVYADLEARVLIIGNLLDGKTLRNLREERLGELMAVPLDEMPLESAIKTVRGTGRNKLVVFADPNCGSCRNFEPELKALRDVTLYTVVYPVLGPESRAKARAILCAPVPADAWRAWMDRRVVPPDPPAGCDPPLDRIVEFGKKKDIAITPTSFLANGKRLVGRLPAATLTREMTGASR